MYYYYYFSNYWYVLLSIIPFILALIASIKVKNTYRKYSKISTKRGITGLDCAKYVLYSGGVNNVRIGQISGEMTDHYNPKEEIINLSQGVYSSNSISAVGVAAHEAGHALQYANDYMPIKIRTKILPLANIGSSMGFYLAILGIFLTFDPLVYIGIGLFFAFVLFELVTLPVEFNASHRAIKALRESGNFTEEEIYGARKVLTAAALTYVAALASALANLLRLVLIAKDNKRR